MITTHKPCRFWLATSILALALASPSALAHNTEGLGAALLGLLGWPIFVFSIAVAAKTSRKLIAILVSILVYPFIIYNVNQVAQFLSPDSWGTEYLLTIIGTALLCLATLACVIFQAKHPVKSARLAIVLAALTIVLLNVTVLLGFSSGSLVSQYGPVFVAIAAARNMILVVSSLLLAEECWREKRTYWAVAFLLSIVLLVSATLPIVHFNLATKLIISRGVVLCWLNLYLLYFGFYLSNLTQQSSRSASATHQRSA